MNERLKQKSKRPGSVYIAVSGTAMLVSLIGFTAVHLSRLELRSANAHNDRAYARQLAYSGVEFALCAIDFDSSWRTNYTHGAVNTRNPLGLTENIIFRFLDNADNDLADDATEPVEIQGIGRIGRATFVYSVNYQASATTSQQVSPPSLRNFNPGSNNWATTTINNSSWIGQYFLPNLPAEATSWTVTSIEVQMAKNGATNSTLDARLYLPDGSLKPGTLIETIAVPESSLPTSAGVWHVFSFLNATDLNPAVGLCLTLTTISSPASDLDYESSGVATSGTHMLKSSGGSWTAHSTQSLYYRVRGTYTTETPSGEFTITPGSWQRVTVP